MATSLVDRKTIDDTVKEVENVSPNRIAAKQRIDDREVLNYSKPTEEYDPEDSTSRQRRYIRGKDTYAIHTPVMMPNQERSAESTAIEIRRENQIPKAYENVNEQSERESEPLAPIKAVEVSQAVATEAVFRSGRQTHPETKEILMNYMRVGGPTLVYFNLAVSTSSIRTWDFSINATSLN